MMATVDISLQILQLLKVATGDPQILRLLTVAFVDAGGADAGGVPIGSTMNAGQLVSVWLVISLQTVFAIFSIGRYM